MDREEEGEGGSRGRERRGWVQEEEEEAGRQEVEKRQRKAWNGGKV